MGIVVFERVLEGQPSSSDEEQFSRSEQEPVGDQEYPSESEKEPITDVKEPACDKEQEPIPDVKEPACDKEQEPISDVKEPACDKEQASEEQEPIVVDWGANRAPLQPELVASSSKSFEEQPSE